MSSLKVTLKSEIAVLRQFFGMRPGDTLKEFKAECDALSVAEKLELAQLAAKQLGLSADDVSFPLE